MTSEEHPTCTPITVVRGKRPMHRSTLILGDQTESVYSTTHAESFSRRGHDGQALVFPFRDPLSPSQHNGKLDLSNVQVTAGQTHSRDVHGPKDIVPHYVLHSAGEQNKTRNYGGRVMKEVTNPNEVTPYQTTYHTEHCNTSTRYLTDESSGHPVLWHKHNIITGEEKTPFGPGQSRRQSGERGLWAARRWETQCDSFRLY
ncbi:uncharacterized protein [Misgurnus anguillicaudatus]|uniref:uncharacterized protein n=1 Tax=Misgurnus anguillicaudatus TaxID=75329 RepID=UPI003CCF9ADA